MNIKKIPDYILSDLKERGLSDEEISEKTPQSLFCEYCDWNGLIGWGPSCGHIDRALKEMLTFS